MSGFGRRLPQKISVVAPLSDPERTQRAVILFTIIAFGVVNLFPAYYIWRELIGVSLELKIPTGGVRIDSDLPSRVRPWAPWWIMPSIVALIAMFFWRALAIRSGRISLAGGTIAMVLSVCSAFPVAIFCLEIGAMLQFDPKPPIWKIATLMPKVAVESVGFLLINLGFHGQVIVPVAAIIGLAFAATSRVLMRITGAIVH